MAKLSAIQRNLKRIKLEKKYQQKRKKFKDIVNNRKLPSQLHRRLYRAGKGFLFEDVNRSC